MCKGNWQNPAAQSLRQPVRLNPGCFCRCGWAHIINLNHIGKAIAGGTILKNGIRISLSRTAAASLRAVFFDC